MAGRDDIGRGMVKLYHCTTKEAAEGIAANGTSREYTGKNGNMYGQGFYTTFNLRSTVAFGYTSGHNYGKYIVQFGLKGGFKNFLFFDEEMNRKYNHGEPVEEQIKRLCPPDIVRKLQDRGFFSYLRHTPQTVSGLNKPMSSVFAHKFYTILRGEPLPTKGLTPWQIENYGTVYDELDLSKTKVRGYIFVGSNDGEVCVVRDFNSLIPLKLYVPHEGGDPTNLNDPGWKNIFRQDTLSNIQSSVDIGTHIRGRYPETPLNTKTVCGYIMVKGRPKGKYNYVNAETMEELLPVPADYAIDFDPGTRTCKFVINGEEYGYSARNNLFFDSDGIFTYTRDEFADELRENESLNESREKIISLIKRIENL